MKRIFQLLMILTIISGCEFKKENQETPEQIKERQEIAEKEKFIHEMDSLYWEISSLIQERSTWERMVDSLLTNNDDFCLIDFSSVKSIYENRLNSILSVKNEYERKLTLFRDRLSMKELSNLADREESINLSIRRFEDRIETLEKWNTFKTNFLNLKSIEEQLVIMKKIERIMKIVKKQVGIN